MAIRRRQTKAFSRRPLDAIMPHPADKGKPFPTYFQIEHRQQKGSFNPPSTRRNQSLLGHASFCGFQRIQFEGIFLDFFLDVSGKITGTLCPLDGGFTVGFAVRSSRIIH
jgi:hypothetical protein